MLVRITHQSGANVINVVKIKISRNLQSSKSVEWSITSKFGDDSEKFEINAGGVLSFKKSPTYFSPLDIDNENVPTIIGPSAINV